MCDLLLSICPNAVIHFLNWFNLSELLHHLLKRVLLLICSHTVGWIKINLKDDLLDSISQKSMKVQRNSEINRTLHKKCIYYFICHKSYRVWTWKWLRLFDENNWVCKRVCITAQIIISTALIRSCWFIAVFIEHRTDLHFPCEKPAVASGLMSVFQSRLDLLLRPREPLWSELT